MSDNSHSTENLSDENRAAIRQGYWIGMAKGLALIAVCFITSFGLDRSDLNGYAVTIPLLAVLALATLALRWRWIRLRLATRSVYGVFALWVATGAAGWTGLV